MKIKMKVYYAKIEELSEEEITAALQILPKERVEKIKKRRQKKGRLESVYAGLLLEYALQELGIKGKELTFLKEKDGKPYLAEYPGIFYNLSHSKRFAALVLDEYPVGIDVEERRIGYQKLAKRFFTEEEQRFCEERTGDERFLEIWTKKESYLKATGYGMRMPLNSFCTLGSQVQVKEQMPDEMREPEAVYYLAGMRLEEDVYLSVCRKNIPITFEKVLFGQADVKKILRQELEQGDV